MMLEYRNITKKFGNKEAVKELTLKLKRARFMAFSEKMEVVRRHL